jgi:parvulin-like peptidyl-prolyl isomerase
MTRRLLICVALVASVACAETFAAAAAVVNGEEISRGELDLQVDAALVGNPSGEEPATRLETARELLGALIRRQLLGQEARRRGLVAAPEEVQALLATIQSRYATEGEFLQAVTDYGLTLEELNGNLAIQVLSTELARDLAPEPSDAEVRVAYEQQADSFRELQVKHILYQIHNDNAAGARRKASKALGVLRARTRTFAQLATTSDEPASARFGGVLADADGNRPGWFQVGTLDATFFDAAYNAPVGRVIGPVRTRFGFHLIVPLRKRTTPLAAVRAQLVADLKERSGQTALEQTIGLAAVRARILINPRYGDWDPATLTIVPHESYVPAEPEPSISAIPPDFVLPGG